MGQTEFPNNWIGDLWDNYELRCHDRSKWQIGKKIAERSHWVPPHFTSTGKGKAEAQAVYHCKQIINDKPSGTKAIAKVRMQVPPDYPASFNSVVRGRIAEQEPFGWTCIEVNSLRYFNENECKAVPRLLHVVKSWQPDPDMPVPDGYLVFLIMEEVPGVPLVNFWTYDRAKRDKIRASFRRSLTELLNLHARPTDCKLDNLIYDEETDTCYIIDLESIPVKKDKPPVEFADYHYFFWGLAYDNNGEEYY
ncbi:hypothetical protein FQN50_004299 [Emmonsiellopsis sp. PD_5]|nr:hypothetical protein FQN50_004299 [Emmonsiellopsis sp. PD_5]